MSVKVVIIGAGGLVGQRLSSALVAEKTFNVSSTEALPLQKITLFDANPITHESFNEVKADPRVTCVVGDLCNKEEVTAVLAPDGCTRVSVIHLAAVLSGYAEENFDLGMKVNLYGSLNVMECVRGLCEQLSGPQIFLYCSTDYVCCFNEANRAAPVTEESFRLSPVSYGCQKACVELMICDYSRKGFIDGRVGRLSAVIGRPGWSNSISYPYTGIFTQPLEGKDYDVPLPMDAPYPCSSLNNNCASLLYLASKVDAAALSGVHVQNRVVQIAAKSYTLNDIWAAAQDVAKEKGIKIGSIKQVAAAEGTTSVKEINVCPFVDCSKAEKLGMPMSVDLHDIIRDYVANHIKK